MGKRFDFNASICENSVFQHKKIMEEDLELLRHYNIRTWNNEDFINEFILRLGRWTISKDRGMFLVRLGGGSFEIPEMYLFIYDGEKINIECGGGGNPARIIKDNCDGSHNIEIVVSRQFIPNYLLSYEDNIMRNIAEAFAVASFRDPHLKKLSVIF
jgi:hypothetical protein